MSDDIVISVKNLGKKYRIKHQQQRQRYVALRDVIAHKAMAPFRWLSVRRQTSATRSQTSDLLPLTSARVSHEDFWALRNVSLEVKQGEVVGIIGRNGAGKSTLLKILSRITEPTEGRVCIRGRVASLLEVGTGFHPELTGCENIFLNGAILGMTRAEIKRKFDEIVAFAEVEKFLDTPVKHYSSGMYVRLAFAVAAHLETEILIVDEVLAVGDAAFQKKCLSKMGDVSKKEGRTVLFVSHNMQTVRQLCSRTILLVGGQINRDGESIQVVQSYLQMNARNNSLMGLDLLIANLPPDPVVRLLGVDITQNGHSGLEIVSGLPLEISIMYDVFRVVSGFHVYFSVYDVDGTMLFESLHNGDAEDIPSSSPGRYVSRATVPADFLANRTYELEINIAIHRVRDCIPQPSPVRVPINVTGVGVVNRAYPGYVTPGKLAPWISWETKVIDTRNKWEVSREKHPSSDAVQQR